MEKFIEHIKNDVKQLHATFSQQSTAEPTHVLKREHEATEKCYIYFKEFSFENVKVRDNCHYTSLHRGAAQSGCNLKYQIPNNASIVFHNLCCYDAYLFNKELAKFNRPDTGLIVENTEKHIKFKGAEAT